MKAGAIAFGSLIWAAPVFGQAASDPLAPLPVSPQPQQTTIPAPLAAPASEPPPTPAEQPIAVSQAGPPPRTVVVPKDWRGVFDAIDAGNWTSARAGIAALPQSILTPVATAELYTAKDSPVVDLASLQTLIAQAPELPEADQLAAMAVKRGATSAPAIIL